MLASTEGKRRSILPQQMCTEQTGTFAQIQCLGAHVPAVSEISQCNFKCGRIRVPKILKVYCRLQLNLIRLQWSRIHDFECL